MKDSIWRQDAIDALRKEVEWEYDWKDERWYYIDADSAIEVIEQLPSAESELHGRIFQEIVVEYPSISTYPEYEGKPYFSIKYVENGQGYIGYGTYNPEVLSGYLKKYFMQSAEIEIIQCKDCRWGREVCGNIECFVDSNIPPEYHGYEWFCPNGERRTDEIN